MSTLPLKNGRGFKQANLRNWHRNTEFWLKARLRHIPHVAPIAESILRRERRRCGASFTVVDMGCGNAWLLKAMRKRGITGQYVGLDFNRLLLRRLERAHGNSNARFLYCDFEGRAPTELLGVADVVVNAFNFFEVPHLRNAFRNAARLMRPGGALLVFHIDPLSQMISLARNAEELPRLLLRLRQHAARLSYSKVIDSAGPNDARVYKGICYRISDYHTLARANGLELEDFAESLDMRDGRPQWYQVALWRK